MSKKHQQDTSMQNKKEVSMNMNVDLWRKTRVAAAERDVTLTRMVEHFLEEGLQNCRHDRLAG
jgi:hypothetical protein